MLCDMSLCFLICVLILLCGNQQRVLCNQSHNLCTDNYNLDACQQVARDQDIKCQFVVTKTDCILDADAGLPTLSILSAEEAFLGAGLVTPTATVFGEIIGENSPYQTAVIVKSGYLGGFEPLRGQKYCHPGYNHDERITKFVLEQLDWKAISLSCNSSKTLTEQKFEAISMLFGSSCRPGKWTEDTELDTKLKLQYPSLCQLCGTNGCNTRYTTPLNNTLSCLTENGGEVALTALRYAEVFFNIGSNAQNFQYLCPNGTVAPSTNPCTWTNQLNRLLLTSSNSASTMSTYIQDKLPSYVNPDAGLLSAVEQHLALLLNLRRSDKINLFTPTPLRTYVSERRPIPLANESIQCGLTLNWSVTTELERNKCLWMQQASLITGLQPVISCVSSTDNDTVSNLDNIRNGNADLAFADANFGYIARKKNLTNVAYPETDTKQLSKIVIVVKNDTNWYSGLKDLQGKKICLPEYGGKEWLAFIDLLRTNRILNNSCDYGKLFSDFVGDSCAPGANSKDLDIANTDSEKLCFNCYAVDPLLPAKYCNADINNKYYDSLGSLTCLQEGNGDYAVIALNDLPSNYLKNEIEAHQQFRIISKNGSLAAYNGFNVDEAAPITIIVAGEIVARNETAKYNETMLYLREIEFEFGQNSKKFYKLFDGFNRTKNLLLPDSTPGLTFDGSQNKFIQNYRTLLENAEICSSLTGGSYRITFPAFVTVFILTILLRLV